MRAFVGRIAHLFILVGAVILFFVTVFLFFEMINTPLVESQRDWFPKWLALPGAVGLLFLAEALRTRHKSLREALCPGLHADGEALRPCSEKSDVGGPSGADAAKVERVITLVHGTFARHAEWMRDDQKLSRGLREELPNTHLSRFCWSGANTHTARLDAGDALATHLRTLVEQFPRAQHFVVGHSHGGNVALYAMKEPASGEGSPVLGDAFSGIITLATPFVALRRRPLPPVIRASVAFTLFFAIAMIAYSAFSEGAAQIQYLGFRKWSHAISLGVLFLGWFVATAVSVTMYRGRRFPFMRLLRLSLRWRDRDGERKRILDTELERLQPEQSVMDRLLVVRPLGDEASMGLVVSQFFAYVQNRIIDTLGSVRGFLLSRRENRSGAAGRSRTARFILFTAKFGILTLLFIWLASRDSLERDLIYFAFVEDILGQTRGEWLYFRMIAVPIMMVLAVYVAFSLASLVGLLGLLFAAIPFGLDAMFWNHFASTTVEASPLGSSPTQIFMGAGSSKGLAHSGIYLDDDAIGQMIEWIRGRAPVVAESA